MSRSQLESRVRQAAVAILPLGARVVVTDRDPVSMEFALSVQTGSTSHELRVGWAGEGWPADVERLLRLAPHVDAVAAHALSVGARDLLDQRGIGWFDEAGAAQLVTESGLLIGRDPNPHPSTPPEQRRWPKSTVTVAEAILTGTDPLVDTAQSVTGLSRGAVAKSLSQLEADGLLIRQQARGPGSKRRLTDFDALLDRYTTAVAENVRKERVLRLHRLWNDPLDALVTEIAPALDSTRLPWAATGTAASMLLAPYLTTFTIVELRVAEELFRDRARLEEVLDARTVDRGHRVEVRSLPSIVTASAGDVIEGVRCVPDVRVYAELTAKGGRSAEAGHHLREVRIDARASS